MYNAELYNFILLFESSSDLITDFLYKHNRFLFILYLLSYAAKVAIKFWTPPIPSDPTTSNISILFFK